MKFCTDATGAQWGVGLTPEGNLRLMRRTLDEPYRAGEAHREEFVTYEFELEEASGLATEIQACIDAET